MTRFSSAVCSILATALLTVACGRPFDVKTPREFVELENQDPEYDYRATTPDGVVVAVRAVDAKGRGTVEFWEESVKLRMRDVSGYALLGAKEVRSEDGTLGKELRFGHDQNGKPYAYRVTVFVAQNRVFLIEAGGAKDAMTRYEPKLDWQTATFRARCSFPGAPVIASRTCNRW
jgi:hypothetical protein